MTSREKIINAAVVEFSKGGYPGARVENIAVKAGVNKAMIFCYFGSKEALYKVIIKKIIGELFQSIMSGELPGQIPEPGAFFDTFTENYIRFFSRNRNYLKIIGTDLIQNPVNLKGALKNYFDSDSMGIPTGIQHMFRKWYSEGWITEPEPMHLILNIISICIFPLIARVFPEVIFNLDLDNDQFISERIRSVQNIIKNGIIK